MGLRSPWRRRFVSLLSWSGCLWHQVEAVKDPYEPLETLQQMKANDGYVYRERLGPESDGKKLIDWLSDRYRHSSREVWLERILAGELKLDGATPSATHLLRTGRELVWHRPPWVEESVPTDFSIVHEDESLLAISKPSGLPTMPAGNFYRNTLWWLVRSRWPDAHPLHRLGRGTSGLVLFAKKRAAARTLGVAFREGRIDRRYLAVASGTPAWTKRRIVAPIGPVPHPVLGTVHASSPSGKSAESYAKVLAVDGDAALVQVDLSTGRPHQIRIHLAHVGHPLLEDPLYGPGGLPISDALPGDVGYLLHAWRLVFEHPIQGRDVTLEAPAPTSFDRWRTRAVLPGPLG